MIAENIPIQLYIFTFRHASYFWEKFFGALLIRGACVVVILGLLVRNLIVWTLSFVETDPKRS